MDLGVEPLAMTEMGHCTHILQYTVCRFWYNEVDDNKNSTYIILGCYIKRTL